MVNVVIFAEGEFEEVCRFGGEAEARGYADGYRAGAEAYAGKVGTYVMPADEDIMIRAESEHEVARALIALAD